MLFYQQGEPLEGLESCTSSPPILDSPFRPHHHKHDHQTGQTDTWILPSPPETSGRRDTDPAARPRGQPDSHDAGHHGPEPVLLQRQTDDREGSDPARTLRGGTTPPDRTRRTWTKSMLEAKASAEDERETLNVSRPAPFSLLQK